MLCDGNPSVSDMEQVKRIGRYLFEKPRTECLFHWQQSGELVAYSDANWGGDKSTRRFGVSWSDHKRWTLFEGVNQEAAGGVTVHCRK